MVAINCDMGEAYSIYRCGDDEGLMPWITLANVACGFHASDPVVMRRTVALAKEHGVKVGAHPSLPDREGFGRREMKLGRDDLVAGHRAPQGLRRWTGAGAGRRARPGPAPRRWGCRSARRRRRHAR